jgi:HPt (histidine-containing phosphotransfer) domain-containing protein
MTATPPSEMPAAMAAAMARLWTKFLPEIEQRIAVLEDAARALSAGTLSEEQRTAAHAAAHKLAGSLGTFGMQRGTDVARAAEDLLAEMPLAASASQLHAAVRELRGLIAARATG